MPKYQKSSKLDNVLYDIRGPVPQEAKRMSAIATIPAFSCVKPRAEELTIAMERIGKFLITYRQ
jgi:hypothetical protein